MHLAVTLKANLVTGDGYQVFGGFHAGECKGLNPLRQIGFATIICDSTTSPVSERNYAAEYAGGVLRLSLSFDKTGVGCSFQILPCVGVDVRPWPSNDHGSGPYT